MSYWLTEKKDTRHKVFISYYHHDDEFYRTEFERLFGHLFINKSVKPGDINADNSAEYIKRLIQSEYLSDASVLVVLVGAKTHCRKHVDWEISAALSKKVGGYSGLMGLILPTHPDYRKGEWNPANVPPRLVENYDSGYAKLYNWTESEDRIKAWIDNAFQTKNEHWDRIRNNSPQFQINRCS